MNQILDFPQVYRLWQGYFSEAKLRPVLAQNDFASFSNVLDLGCGPGINSKHFSSADYVGVDINPRYVRWAQENCRGTFICADAVTFMLPTRNFDCILVNSLCHHLDDNQVNCLFANIQRMLTGNGYFHLVDVCRAEEPGLPKLLLSLDRGEFARSSAHWQSLYLGYFVPEKLVAYDLRLFGMVAYKMFYLKAVARADG